MMTRETSKPPHGLEWRSSSWFVTLVVGIGIATDLGIYTMIIPVIPYRLQSLGYTEISSKTSYLLLAYSLSLILATPPVVWACERLGGARRGPLLTGIFFLAISLVLFMFAPNYAVFVVARVLQGVSGSVVWVVGLALLCDTVPEDMVGQQLGFAMSGVTIGSAIGPPIGGVLYQKLGFHAPFIFCIGMTVVDFTARLFVIEREEALRWKEPPEISLVETSEARQGSSTEPPIIDGQIAESSSVPQESSEPVDKEKGDDSPDAIAISSPGAVAPAEPSMSQYKVVWLMLKTPRSLASLIISMVFGVVLTSQEPTLTLRVYDIWGLDSFKVGLIYLGVVVPTVLSGILGGTIADRYGAEFVVPAFLMLALPWYLVLIAKSSLVLFIAAMGIATFFLNGIIAPATGELATTSRLMPGVTYGHIFGGFNVAYSIGSAIGPIIGGQLYDHAPHGWVAVCIFDAAIALVAGINSIAFIGSRPLLGRLVAYVRGRRQTSPAASVGT